MRFFCLCYFADGVNDIERVHARPWHYATQATGAHPNEGMTSAQLQELFERTARSPIGIAREKLARIVNYIQSGDGLVSGKNMVQQ